MIFNIKHNITVPRANTTRVLMKYAWLPKVIVTPDGAKLVWLGRYQELQAYIVTFVKIEHEGKPYTASMGRWETLEKRIR